MNRIFYIMGKSSSGKDTIYKRIIEEFKFKSVTLYTTRPMRENEHEGDEYYFVSRETFEDMKKKGEIIESRIYDTVYGEWIYFTALNSVDISGGSAVCIGTLESFLKVREKFGEIVEPIYIEVDDGIRLERALNREKSEENPKYKEMCRRFISDSEDFSEENLINAGIKRRFENNVDIEACIEEIKAFIQVKENE